MGSITTVGLWEFRSFFRRPGGWLAVFTAVATATFAASWLVALLARKGVPLRPEDDPIIQFLGPNLFLIGTVFWLVPFCAMSQIAGERNRGAWELLVTSPGSLMAKVLGKFFATWFLIGVCLSPWPLLLIALRLWSGELPWETPLNTAAPRVAGLGVQFDLGYIIAGGVGLILLAGTLAGMATLCSAIGKRPLIAALGSTALVGLSLALSFIPRILNQWNISSAWSGWIDRIAIWNHLATFARGEIVVSQILGMCCLTVIAIWLSTRFAEQGIRRA